MESAANILLRGKVCEALGETASACWQYENALQVAELLGQPAETGEIHHGIGRCASRMGNPVQAYKAYLAAARMYLEHGAPQGLPNRLSDALGEAGMLLVAFGPGISVNDLPEEELLDRGLDDAMLHAGAILFGVQPPTRAGMAALHRKLTGHVVLAASASFAPHLSRLDRELSESILTPFYDRYGMSAAPLYSLSRLLSTLGDLKRRKRVTEPAATRSEVRASVAEVGRFFREGERSMMIRWLVSHLREQRGAIWLTQETVPSVLEEF